MKKFFGISYLAFLAHAILLAQGQRVTIKVINASDQVEVESAIVEIEQIPGVVYTTDQNGIVIFKNVPEGRVTIGVRKNGYIKKTEFRYHVSTEAKNNYFEIALLPVAKGDEYLFYGEVSDSKGEKIIGASVEIKVLNIIKKTKTGSSGDFSFIISESEIKESREYKIEVRYNQCSEPIIKKEQIPKHKNVEVNLIADCKNKSESILNNLPQQWEGTFKNYPPNTEVSYPMILYLDYSKNGLIKGKLNWPNGNNLITTFEGEIVDRPSDFIEESKWRLVDKILKDKNGIWLKFTENGIITGTSSELHGQYYCHLSKDGSITGCWFSKDKNFAGGEFKILPSK